MAWFSSLPPLVQALLQAAGVVTGAGVITVAAERLWPSANRRLDDVRDRRREDDDSIRELRKALHVAEEERDEWQAKWLEERELRIVTRQEFANKDIELELLRSKLGMPRVVTPRVVEEDRALLPPGMPHDDREPAP